MGPDLTVLEVLRRHGVPFVIIGGLAVYYHGYERLTEDVDIVWLRSPESEKVLFSALTEMNAQWIGKEIDPQTRLERLYPVTLLHVHASHLMMLFTRYGFVDFFDYVPGMPNEDIRQLFTTSVEDDRGQRYTSIEWLRKMKKAAGRPKDLLDLENLPE